MNLFEELERLIKQKGHLTASNTTGGGMGLYWMTSIGHEWPYCSGATLESALKNLISEHHRLEREALQARINAIDGSAQL